MRKKLLALAVFFSLISLQAKAEIIESSPSSSGSSGTVSTGTAGQPAVYIGTSVVGSVSTLPYKSTTSIANRAPTSTDDSTLGYAVGNFWNANGKQWVAQAVGAATANWQLQPPLNAPACDVVTGAVGCYGVYRLKANYAGNAFQIQRNSDSTTLNIAFDVNGIASWAAVDNFCAGTTCGVKTWYDQSGNGYDLTQSTFASMPPVYAATIGNQRAISFSTSLNAAATTLSNSSLPITTRNTFTTVAVIYPNSSSNQTTVGAYFGLNSASSNWFYYTDIASSNGMLRVSPGSGNTPLNTMLSASPQVFVSNNNAGTLTTCQNNVCTAGIATGFSSAASTGLILGGNNVYGYYQGSMVSFVIYNSSLSAANQQLLQQAAFRDSGIAPQAKVNILLQASSLICCAGGTVPPNQMFPMALQSAVNDPVRVVADGYAGQSLNNLNSQTSAVAAQAYVAGMTNIFIPDAGSNDFAASTTTTAANVYGYLQTACSTAHSAGFKCYIMSLFPRQGSFTNGQTASGFETARQSLLALEKAGWSSFADGFIDPADDPVVGPQSATANTSLFTPDQVHLALPLGQSYEAAIHARGLSGYVQ